MRTIRVATEAPPQAVQLVGVLGGEPLDHPNVRAIGIDGDTLTNLGFNGDPGKTLAVAGNDGPAVLVGLGDELDLDVLRRAAGAGARAVPAPAVLVTALHMVDLDGAPEAVVAGLIQGSYRFEEYRSGERTPEGDIVLVGDLSDEVLERGLCLGRAVNRARDWVNRSAADTAPAVLAEEMGDLLTEHGFAVEIWNEDRIDAERLAGLAAVAAGSDRAARLVVGRYRPNGARVHLALVGKGIVFDSGGLSIKTAELMETMKCDMAGAAAVVAGAAVAAELETAVDITVFVPLTDNMSGGSATRPGDVLTFRNGKTAEVLNTDAEGRLVLADALSLAVEEEPDVIVDLATLTGAARVALGDHIAAMFASSDELAELVGAAAESAGERLWRLPLPGDYRKLIDSSVADMKNTGGRSGSTILAALFLAEFVADVPWVHLDIAAPAFLNEEGWHGPKGGTGMGVRTVAEIASRLQTAATPSI